MPHWTREHAAEILGRIGTRMVGRNGDEQVDGHSEQELHDEHRQRDEERLLSWRDLFGRA
jgi:hypothetical protein